MDSWEKKDAGMCSRTLLRPSDMHQKALLLSMAPYDLHKRLINDYILCRKGATALLQRDSSRDKTDIDVIRENHKFLWDDDDNPDTWEAQLAKRYHDKLFKEYGICDLSRYTENKVAMRWRTEPELVAGRGQFSCGEKHCNEKDNLRTWEVNFAYQEHGERKNALIKLRLCPNCSTKLNFHSQKREVRRQKRKTKKHKNHGSKDKKDTKSKKRKFQEEDSTGAEDKKDQRSEVEDEANIWRESGRPEEEKTREEEFEEYLEDLFL